MRSWPKRGSLISSAIAIVDTGPLYAAADIADHQHERSLEILRGSRLPLVVPRLVVGEAAYMG